MALHERFSEYTKEEIMRITKNVCMKNNCPYLGRLITCNAYNGKDTSSANKTCNYMLYTGKMRECMPDECTHYTDTGVKKQKPHTAVKNFNRNNDYYI